MDHWVGMKVIRTLLNLLTSQVVGPQGQAGQAQF